MQFFPQKFRDKGIFRIRSLSSGQGCATMCSCTSALKQRWCGLNSAVFLLQNLKNKKKKAEPSQVYNYGCAGSRWVLLTMLGTMWRQQCKERCQGSFVSDTFLAVK